MIIAVTNIDNLTKILATEEAFLEYVREVYEENEGNDPYGPSEIHWSPENIQQAKEYVHEYCSDLTLEECEGNVLKLKL